MNVVGLGIDVVNVKKLKKIIKGKNGKRFVENTFTESEIKCAKNGSNVMKLATAFAAKEAVYKAFETGWIEGKDVELLREKETGAPRIKLYGKIAKMARKEKIKKVLVSLSFTECCAVAVVLLIS